MQRRYNLPHLILAVVMVLVLTSLMVRVEAQAQIAFVSERDGNPEIYVMDINGNNQRRLTNNRHEDWSPSWSPNGKRIAFQSNRDWDNPQNTEIYVMDVDGKNEEKLTENPNEDEDPSWSPNGKQIAFSSVRKEHFENEFKITTEIYVMDTDGGNQQRLTENLKNDWFPVWSPDGKQIAFSSDRKGDFENFEIYVMDADGGNQRRLTENRSDDWNPSWSPDGERIAFMSERTGNSEIYVIDNDGDNPQNLTNHPDDDWDPTWLNSPFSVSPAGKKFTMWGWLKQVNR